MAEEVTVPSVEEPSTPWVEEQPVPPMAGPPSPPAGDITDNDRFLAAVSYPIPLVAIVVLLVEEMRVRPFQKYHAVQALAVNVVLWVAILLLGCILGAASFVIGGACGAVPALLWLVTLYWAYEAYMGKYFAMPGLTKFLQDQKWL
jgi:uncharacterized membrane protein